MSKEPKSPNYRPVDETRGVITTMIDRDLRRRLKIACLMLQVDYTDTIEEAIRAAVERMEAEIARKGIKLGGHLLRRTKDAK
jgi:hypothetical protein